MVWAVSLLTMDLSTHCLTPGYTVHGIRSLTGLGNPWRAPHPISALPPRCFTSRLALKLFRGEPAISEFDWNFSPTPTSSPHFSTAWVRASSECYRTFTLDRGRSHGFGSTTTYLFALFRLAFAAAPPLQLNLARERNSPVHSTKGTPSPLDRALTFCKHTVSGSFSLRSRGAFHLSLTVLLHYRSLGSI